MLSRIDFSKHKKKADEKAPGGVVEVEEQYQIKPILPRAGLVYSEKSNLTEVMCKPKILPLKSTTLQKMEKLEAEAEQVVKQQRLATAAAMKNQDQQQAYFKS